MDKITDFFYTICVGVLLLIFVLLWYTWLTVSYPFRKFFLSETFFRETDD